MIRNKLRGILHYLNNLQSKTLLYIIIFLLLVLIWMNRYSYTNNWSIDNLTGIGCHIATYKASENPFQIDFSKRVCSDKDIR